MASKFEVVDGYKLRKKVRAVIANERSEFLLIQPHGYAADTWTLVGGGVEDGEDDEQAIIREIHEETGIATLTEIHPSAARHWYTFSDRVKTKRQLDHDGQIAKVFFVTVAADSVVKTQAAEVQAHCWASASEVETLIRVPEQQALFREVVAEFAHHPIARQVLNKSQYGRCCRCGRAVESARLAVNPATPHCIDCVLELDSDCC